MENRDEGERHPTGRREFLRGAGLAACTTALGLAESSHRARADSAGDGKGAREGSKASTRKTSSTR